MRRRVAIFLVGGLGGGIGVQGVPAISAVTAALAERFDVTAYSLVRPDPAFEPPGYCVRSPPPSLGHARARKLRWLGLAARFLADSRRRPYDALLSFWGYPMGPLVLALAGLVRKPSIVAILGAEAAAVPSVGYGHLRRPTTRRLVLEVCARASRLVVLSDYQREALHRHGLRRSDVDVVPFGVDSRTFAFRPRRREPPLKLLHVANLTPIKDQATLLRGFALLRREMPAKLRLVGPDHMRGSVHALVADLGLGADVELVGPVPYGGIAQHYHWADAFLLTSLYEGQSTALTEAAMTGALLVSTPVGYAQDIGSRGAVLVRPGDPADLARRIRDIAGDGAEWERKVVFARAWAEARDLRFTVGRYASIIEEACRWTSA
jgi:glycosyltransferase involved in cell wall biosynthesis